MCANIVNLNEVTTPILHHVVRQFNDKKSEYKDIDGYYRMLGTAFTKTIRGYESIALTRDELYVDCANGAGQLVVGRLQQAVNGYLKLVGFNTQRENLNHLAGANYLYTQKAIPTGFTAETAVGKRFCSLDGDADRLLYWRVSAEHALEIMDGDKEMALAALWVRKQLDDLALEDVSMGVVKTAYANGASNDYMREHGIAVVLAKTGVKHLHPLAEKFDVGMYFEANGHGTVLFKPAFVERLRGLDEAALTVRQREGSEA